MSWTSEVILLKATYLSRSRITVTGTDLIIVKLKGPEYELAHLSLALIWGGVEKLG